MYSEFKVMLCCSSQLYPCAFWSTTSGLCIETWAYQAEPPVTDVELNSQNCSNSKKWHSTAISCATSAFKHFTVQKCWKLWSCFLLLFKEKINAVITLVRFPSWKHGHEIRLLRFHFDGGMSEWYWEVDVQPRSMHLVWIICLCQTRVANSSLQDNWKKQSKSQTAHVAVQWLNATDCMQILNKSILCAVLLLLYTCVWHLCVVLVWC